MHGMHKPIADSSCTRPVLGDVKQNRAKGDQPGRDKEALGWMRDGCHERGRIIPKATAYQHDVHEEERYIEKKEHAPDGVEAVEPVWHMVEHVSHATCGHLIWRLATPSTRRSTHRTHRHREPGPCKMPYPLLEPQMVYVHLMHWAVLLPQPPEPVVAAFVITT